jgi:hypothetical protein
VNRWAERRLAVATHEAGHALVAIALGVDIRSATIGHAYAGAEVHLVEQDQGGPEAQAMIRIAGRRALAAYGLLDASTELGCRADLEEAQSFALAAAGGNQARADVLLEELSSRVDELLFVHHVALGEISIALLERGELTGAELLAITHV